MESKTNSRPEVQIQLNVLAFGIAKDIIGGSSILMHLPESSTVLDLKQALLSQFPRFEKLVSLAIGVNGEYAADDQSLNSTDEIVIIPPVSGG